MRVIDIHTHVFPGKDPRNPVDSGIEEYLRGVDEVPVEKLVVLPAHKNVIGLPFEELFPRLKDHPKIYFAQTLLVEGKENLEEEMEIIRERFKHPKVVAMKLYPGYDRFYPYDERLDPLYEFLEKKRIPIILHSGETYEEIKHASPHYSHPLNFYPVAERFPKLRMILAHVGYPWFHDVGELLLQFEHVYTDISEVIPPRSCRYWGINMEMVRRGVLEAISIVGEPTKFLYGTDWVIGEEETYRERYWNYITFLHSLPATEEELEEMRRGVAEKLFFRWKD